MSDKTVNVFHALVREGLLDSKGKNSEGQELYAITLAGAAKITEICTKWLYEGLNGAVDGEKYRIADGINPEDLEIEYAMLAVKEAGGPIQFLVGYYLEELGE